jgi:dipeptide transport system permease protein
MLKFLLNRIFVLIPTLVGISIVAFGLIRLVPGDPVLVRLGERGADPAAYQAELARMGLDKPIPVQYFIFVSNALTGDLGNSSVSRRPVVFEIFSRFPATLELGLTGLLWAILLGIPLGILAAVKRNSPFDYLVTGGSLVGYSMPIFWWGLILIMWFSVGLGVTPVSGRIDVIYDIAPITGFLLLDSFLSGEGISAFLSALNHLVLPAICLGTIPLASIARMTRSSMLGVLGEDYIRTAKAKGVPKSAVIGVHALRNALIPVVTVIGMTLGTVVTGAILTETIFSWPGIGRWIVQSVLARDFNSVQGGILLFGTLTVLINMAVDVVYAIVNPKMRGMM